MELHLQEAVLFPVSKVALVHVMWLFGRKQPPVFTPAPTVRVLISKNKTNKKTTALPYIKVDHYSLFYNLWGNQLETNILGYLKIN